MAKTDFSTIRDAVVNTAKGVRTFITGIDTEEVRKQVVNLLDTTASLAETTFTSATTTSGSGVYAYDTTGSTVTLTVASQDITDGKTIIVKDKAGGAGTNAITVATEGSENIDGSSTTSVGTNYGVVRLYSDGSNLFTW